MSDSKESKPHYENEQCTTAGAEDSEFRHLFPIDTYDVKTKTNHDVSIVLMGEAVSNLSRIAMNSRNAALKALKEHL